MQEPQKPQEPRRSRHWTVDLGLGAILGAFASLLVSVMFEETTAETVARWSWVLRNPTAQPSCEDPGWYEQITPLRVDPGSVLYEGDRVNQWEGGHLMHDGFAYTSWLGRDDENLANKRVNFAFAGTPRLAFACVINGNVENVLTYFGNGRIDEFAIEGCGDEFRGSFVETAGTVESWIPAEAGKEHQIDLDCTAASLALQILSTHPQDRDLLNHEGDTVSISEISFYEIP